MFRSRWLQNLLVSGHSHKDRRRLTARPRRGVRLMLEALEDRLTPSTVEYAPDAATLQTDLNNATAANTQYVINLTGASSAYNLASGQELTVSAASGSSVSIVGSGQSITGNGNRVFFIDPDANVTLQNLTITGGSGVANGGGVYAAGSDWTVALIGDTLSDNTATAGAYGTAAGGAAFFSATGGSCRLTILNNLAAPIADPSIMIDNQVHAGADGDGGLAEGGALYIGGSGASLTANIGNTAFYGNLAQGGNGGTADGGGVYLGFGNVTMVNCTVASNKAGIDTGGSPGTTSGGGIYDADTGAVILDNNTVYANTLNSPFNAAGSGVLIASGNPTLINNLIKGNTSSNSSTPGFDTNGIFLSNAINNAIGVISANAVNPATNIILGPHKEIGGVMGVNTSGQPSGGPIYCPLWYRAYSIGSGTTSVLSTIAAVEGTTISNATDALGNFLSANGSIDIGAVQVVLPAPPAPPHHSPPAPPQSPPQSSSPLQAIANELESLLSSLEAEINLLLEIIQSILR